MTKFLRIGSDPIPWVVTDEQAEALYTAVTESDEPVAVDVSAPWDGRLLVAPTAAGSIAILASAPEGGGWVPSDVDVPTARIYVPCATQAPDGQLGYPLAEDTDLAALEYFLLCALRDGTTMMVPIRDTPEDSRLVLTGPALTYVVLRRARP